MVFASGCCNPAANPSAQEDPAPVQGRQAGPTHPSALPSGVFLPGAPPLGAPGLPRPLRPREKTGSGARGGAGSKCRKRRLSRAPAPTPGLTPGRGRLRRLKDRAIRLAGSLGGLSPGPQLGHAGIGKQQGGDCSCLRRFFSPKCPEGAPWHQSPVNTVRRGPQETPLTPWRPTTSP